MTVDSTLLYVLIFVLSAIALLTVALGVAFWFLFLKYKTLKEKALDRAKEETLLYQKTLEQAKREATLIMEEAQKASKSIISQAVVINKEQTSDLEKLVRDTMMAQGKTYENALSLVVNDIEKTFRKLPEDLQLYLKGEIQKLTNAVQIEIKGIQGEFRSILDESNKLAQKEVEAHKLSQMKEFEKKLFVSLQSISKEVLRKELTMEEHEKLVIKALEHAKEEGILK